MDRDGSPKENGGVVSTPTRRREEMLGMQKSTDAHSLSLSKTVLFMLYVMSYGGKQHKSQWDRSWEDGKIIEKKNHEDT